VSTVALTFKETGDTGKTKVWQVSGPAPDSVVLGWIGWWTNWRRYVYHPYEDTIYDADCLTQITGFIAARMKERKSV
jgi:hypothetical protein